MLLSSMTSVGKWVGKRRLTTGARIISLWVSINSALLLRVQNVDTLTAPEDRREMAAAWGEINRRYAEDLYKSDVNSDTMALSDGFEERFAHPYANLTKQIMEFMTR